MSFNKLWSTIKGFRQAKKVQTLCFKIVGALCKKCKTKADVLIKKNKVMEMDQHICGTCFKKVLPWLVEMRAQVTILSEKNKKDKKKNDN